MTVLLDTNAYIHLQLGEPQVTKVVARASRICMSTIVLGELLYGFKNGTKATKNLGILEQFLESRGVFLAPVDRETSEWYGLLSAQLRRQGRPIPTNDIWIAAQTIHTQATLISFDAHFQHLDSIRFRHLTSP